MPDILMATNTGPSIYGPATGKKIKMTGLVNSFIEKRNGKWVYTMEYGVHDTVTLLNQLGFQIIPNSTIVPPESDETNDAKCETWIDYFKKERKKYISNRKQIDAKNIKKLENLMKILEKNVQKLN